MNTAFLDFNDSTLKSGLADVNPRLAHDLKHVTETFVTLANTAATEESYEVDDESGEATQDPEAVSQHPISLDRNQQETQQTTSSQFPIPQYTDVGWGYSATLTCIPTTGVTSPSHYDGPSLNSIPSTSRPPHEVTESSGLVRSATARGTLPFGLVDMVPKQTRDLSNPHRFSAQIVTPGVTPPTTRLSTPPLFPSLSSLSTRSLDPTWTYSHEETDFARRLNRAALEGGFHVLSSGNINPRLLSHVFKLSLAYMNVDELRDRFRMLLRHGTDESLDCWGAPLHHFGGAGTHFPRKNADGSIIPMPSSWNVKRIGPLPSEHMPAEDVSNAKGSQDLHIDITGYEGEWFDPYDVQGYLEQEKGCHINPRDSFAEVEVEVDEATNMTELGSFVHMNSANWDVLSGLLTDTTSDQSTPVPNLAPVFPPGETFGLNNMDITNFSGLDHFNENQASDMFNPQLDPQTSSGFENTANAAMPDFNTSSFGYIPNPGLDMLGTNAELPGVKQKRKQTAWVDVSKLIDGKFAVCVLLPRTDVASELLQRSICLGRAPGFRRKDVDIAFQASLISAF